jgi:NAD(P)H-hydrate epimerase
MKLVTTEEMRRIESEADAGGHSYDEMMAFAGKGLAEVVRDRFGHLQNSSALGLVGSGNNGGDTLVALRHLAEAGWRVHAYLVKKRETEDPLMESLEAAGGEITLLDKDAKMGMLKTLLGEHSVLLDGVLGTGIKLPLRGAVAKALQRVKETMDEMVAPPAVVGVDCPSGVDTDSGEMAPETLPADITVTMAAVKTGLVRMPAFKRVGDLVVVDIGLPEDLEPWKEIQREVADAASVLDMLPERPMDAHKGTFGAVMVVAGSVNFTGAALLAGQAAYRAGAGLVTLAVPNPLYGALAGAFPEATWLLLPHEIGVISENAADIVLKNLDRVTAVVLGPGYGQEDTTRNFLAHLLGAQQRPSKGGGIGFVRSKRPGEVEVERKDLPPLVIDADGLKLLSEISDWAAQLPSSTVLTPHPGEMSVMTGLEVDEIQADRLGVAERYAHEWGHVLVLKGALTVIAAPDGRSTVVPVASPALARAGTGDVLTGLIAGLRGQGVDAYESAVAGAWIHAQAGVLAADFLGSSATVLAGDVLAAVVDVLGELG